MSDTQDNKPDADAPSTGKVSTKQKRHVFYACALAVIGGMESFGIGQNLLKPFFSVEDHRMLIIMAGLATAVTGCFAVFVFAMHLFARHVPHQLFRLSGPVLSGFVAFQMGLFATLMVFGESSPWGHIIKGISGGPLIGWLDGIISPAWWPLPFIAVSLLTLGVISHVWADMKTKGFLTPDGRLA